MSIPKGQTDDQRWETLHAAAPAERPKAHACAETRDWPGYFRSVAGREPRETLLDALARFDAEGVVDVAKPPLAIDLGCGEGRDAAELLRRGWRVLAIDGHPMGLDLLGQRSDIADRRGLETRLASFEEIASGPLPACRLVNASFSLPFCPPSHFAGLWSAVRGALEPAGRFAGQFFGERDSWASIPDRSHQTRDEVLTLLDGLEIERLDEEERDGADCHQQAKRWHVFHVVARRPG